MIAVKEHLDVYLSSFLKLEKQLPGSGRSWIDQIRKAGIHSFAELGFPSTHHEEWKYTNVAPVADIQFQLAPCEFTESIAEKLGRVAFADLEYGRLVFVNGHYCRELSSPEMLPKGVKAGSLAAALEGKAPSLEEHLARYAGYKDRAFVALNTAFINDGAFIEIPKGLVLEKPIHLLFVSTGNGQPTVSHPRNLILVGRESQAILIEGYVGLGKEVTFTNAVTEIVAGEGAVLDYNKLQQESERSFHIANVQVQQDRSSSVTTCSISFGGALVREEVNAVLGGEGAEAMLNGLYVTTGQQHVDNHTRIDHAKPHCNSRELYKGILDGKSTGVFNGKIIVRKDAQKTDAKQSNKNLLLSQDAVINTKPQLEIYADDVKCTHGATIGQLDPEAIFYLRSRGIGLEAARNLLTRAFGSDIIGRIKVGPIRDRLEDALLARLSKAWRAEETP